MARDYAAEYARRQARARAAGFSGYYEQRTRPSPGAPRPSTEELSRLRGHRGFADLLRSLGEGDIVSVDPGSERNALGQWDRLGVTVIDGDDGTEREYLIRDLDREMIDELLDRMDEVDADDSDAYGINNLI